MTGFATSSLSPDDLVVDHELADIALGFRFLLDVTPVNGNVAREAFVAGRADQPAFEYRTLEDDPTVIRSRLDGVAVDAVVDDTVRELLQAKQRELELQLEMLSARGTEAFRSMSIELYGTVAPPLLATAQGILEGVPSAGVPARDLWLDADTFAARAEAELDRYRASDPDLSVYVEVRSDCSEIMVSNGVLLIPSAARVHESRVDALLQHEIGTHAITFVNGSMQPLKLLASGLAGYDETQEALALLSEHLVGGFTAKRLRQIAARVVAVDLMLDGASFRVVYDSMLAYGFSPGSSFAIAMRVHRSGGLTKDAVYLRGLSDLLDHLGTGGSLDVLWLGKLALRSAPQVQALRDRRAIGRAHLLPRYLADPGPQQRLDRLGAGLTPNDLAEE